MVIMISLKDANGQYHVFKEQDVLEAFTCSDFQILGMSLNVLLEIRNIYLEKAGVLPITVSSVREILK